MARLFGYVDVTDSGFIVAVLSIAFNPLFWNVGWPPHGSAEFFLPGRIQALRRRPGVATGAQAGAFSLAVMLKQCHFLHHFGDGLSALGTAGCNWALVHSVGRDKVARWEHKTRVFSRVFGSPHVACYCLGAVILVLNCVRSHCFTEAMKSQPKLEVWDCHWTYYSGLAISAVGTLFVISSFLALGFTGTFLGDYFGILMEEKVTSFPFNILDNPMYWGSTAIYLGWSLMHASPAGLLLTAVVAISYTIATLYEGPFTEEIYQQKQKGVKNK